MLEHAVNFYKNLFGKEPSYGVRLKDDFWDEDDLVTVDENEALQAPFDEPIAPISNVVIRDSLEISGLKFGVVSFDKIYIKKAEEIFTIGGLSSKINFIGAHVVKKMEEKKRLKQYIFVGSIKIEIIGEAPG
jgi:hypothetical protein